MIYHRYRKRREIMLDRLAALEAMANANVLEYLYLKGFHYERYYPHGIQRFIGDIDIAIPDLETVWPFVAFDFANGDEHCFMPMIRVTKQGTVAGIVKMEQERVESKYEFFGVEYSVGGVNLSDATLIPWSTVHANCEMLDLGDFQVKVPSLTNQLVLLIGEMLTNHRILFRDVMDYVLLLAHVTKEQLMHAFELLKEYSLMQEFQRINTQTFQQDLLLQTLLNEDVYELIQARVSDGYLEEEQQRVYQGHLLPYLSQMYGEEVGMRMTAFVKNREQEDAELSSEANAPRHVFEQGYHVYLNYLGDHVKGETDWMQADSFTYLKTPVGLYLVTYAEADDDEFERAYQLSLGWDEHA